MTGHPAGHRPALGQVERLQRLVAVAATRADRLTLLGQVADAQFALGRWRQAEATLRDAVPLAEELADHRALVACLTRLANAVQHLGRGAEADELFDRATGLARGAGGAMTDLEGEASHAYGAYLAEHGRPDDAVAHLRRALAIRRSAGDRAGAARTEKLLDGLGAPR